MMRNSESDDGKRGGVEQKVRCKIYLSIAHPSTELSKLIAQEMSSMYLYMV